MDAHCRRMIWSQLGAAIDMLENAVHACPDALWSDRGRQPEYWYLVSHTLFWLDFYLEESPVGFAPPAPFGLEELDPSGVLPPRVYTKAELLDYMEHGREKCRATIATMTDEQAGMRFRTGWVDLSREELLLYSLRHVQHHTAQLNLILRQTTDSAPRWVGRTQRPLAGEPEV